MTTSLPPADAHLRSLVDGVGAIVWEATIGATPQDVAFSFVSEGSEPLLGYRPERWVEEPAFWFSIVHPDDRAGVAESMAGVGRERRGADFEFRVRAADGHTVWLRNIVQPPEADGRVRGVVVDVTDRRVAQDRLDRVQRLTASLSGLLGPREVAALIAAQGRSALGATAVGVFLRDGDELEIAGYDAAVPDPGEPCRIPLDADVPAAAAVRGGRALYFDGAELARAYPAAHGWRRLGGDGALCALPLVADGQVLGSLALRLPAQSDFGEGDRVLLDVLARACAQALGRAQHVDAERAARRSAEDANAVLDAIISSAPEGFALFDRDLRYVRVNDALAAINGVPVAEHAGRTLAEIVPGVPAEGHEAPLRQVLETGRAVVDIEVSGLTAADPDRERTWLVTYYPIRDAAGEIGWLGGFVVDITARKRAERESALLAQLAALLDEVLSVEERLARLVEILVPGLADMAGVFLAAADGTLERVSVRHVEREREPDMTALDVPSPHAMDRTVVVDEVEAAGVIAGIDVSARAGVGARSALLVPLVVRERPIGALSLASLRPRAFGAAEVAFAEEVARRAALAVDNARLLERERVARERAGRLYAVAAGLAEALTPADVATAALSHVTEAVGGSRATVWQVTEDEAALEPVGWSGDVSGVIEDYRRIPLSEGVPVTEVARTRRPVWLEAPEQISAGAGWAAAALERAGTGALAVVPLTAAGALVGVMTVAFDHSQRFDPERRGLLAALAAQCGQALERARLYETERRVAVTLQRSLLPASLPEIEGLQIGVRYLPARGLEAGGDFYEALPLAGGALGIAVGDVVGRGATAAATMGQLRSALRAFALLGEPPSQVLTRLSGFATTVAGALASTAVYAQLDPATGELRYACAGHPWPLLVHPDGRAEYLQEGRSVPLGCIPDPVFYEAVAQLAPGSTLLLYTDGLTERRGEDVLAVMERLRTAVAERRDAELDALLDGVVSAVGETAPQDDVALVAVRRAPIPAHVRRLRYPAAPPQVAEARGDLRAWLGALGVDAATSDDVLLACGEAVANAVEHAYARDDAGHFEVRLTAADDGVLAIEVADRGRWRPPAQRGSRGRGIALMRALMDEVDVRTSAHGTLVRMRRRWTLSRARPA